LTERIPDLSTASHIAETWISAGFNISLVHRIVDDKTGSTAKREMMFQLGQFQFATELAYSRLHQRATKGTAMAGGTPSFAPLLACSADAHALLVSGSGYWRGLQDLLRLMPFPDLVMVTDKLEWVVKATVMARNHIEHITERIANGRKRRTAVPEISAEAFQQAIGRIEFPLIIFGDESFDLAAISGTILTTGSRIALTLETTFQTGIDKYFDAILPIASGGDS
jgi:hypothetical protein